MSCQEPRESELCGDCPLSCLGDEDRNFASTIPSSMDLDSMCLSYQLPRYLVSASCEVEGEELPVSIELDRSMLFADKDYDANLQFVESRVDIEAIFQSNPSSEKIVAQPKKTHPTKTKRDPKRATRSSIKLEEGKHQLNFKLNYQHAEEKEISEPEFKNRHSCSEPPTEDSASAFEMFSFPGLAGSHGYFKKAACVACKQSKIAFCFGDVSSRKECDKFTCADCIRNSIGEENFLSLLQIECQWSCNSSCNMSQKKPWQSLKQYVHQYQAQNIESTEISINYLIEKKKCSVQKTLKKLNAVLMTQKSKAELETLLLCLRFVHDLIESLNRLIEILSMTSLKDKFARLDQTERDFYQLEINKIEPVVSAIRTETNKTIEAKASREQAICKNPAESLGFGLDYEETPTLGKRDITFRDPDSFLDIDVPDLDLPYKITPFSGNFMLPYF